MGKAFLVREFFGDSVCFELTGLHDASTSDQIERRCVLPGLDDAVCAPPVNAVVAAEYRHTVLPSCESERRDASSAGFP
jgi:hypothetical protein